jgi:hypothetical protein
VNCHACGTPLAPAAKFCHKCGAAVPGAPSTGWRAGLPWGIAGLALGALVTVVALRVLPGFAGAGSPLPGGGLGGGSVSGATDGAGGAGGGAGGGAAAIDISQMSPEERATRLYNRVMLLHSQGKVDSAEFFLPMALQAYAMLPALDVDARYHIGVLNLTAGNAAAALAQADTMRRSVPTHLFAFMLESRASELKRDTIGARRAYRNFLKNEAAERARGRPEYSEHAENLTAFHEQAMQATAGQAARGR